MASPESRPVHARERAIDGLLWLLALASAALTVWLSIGAVPPGAEAFPGADKVLHGAAYFVTTLLLLFAAVWRPVRGDGSLARFGPLLIVAVVVSGLAVELMQGALTTDREPELMDWFADSVGALAALLSHRLVRRVVSTQAVVNATD